MKKLKRFLSVILVVALAFNIVACNQQITLEAPKNLECTNSVVTFDAVDGALGYVLSINDEEVELGTVRSYTLGQTYSGELKIKVKAVGDNEIILDSEYSEEIVVSILPALAKPQNLAVNDGEISWDTVDGAEGYVLKINNELIDVDAPPFSLRSGDVGTLNISVKAVANDQTNRDSDFCDPIIEQIDEPGDPVQLLPPANLHCNDDLLVTYDQVDGATGYVLKINNTEIDRKQNLSYSIPALLLGKLDIQVKAVGDNIRYSDSSYSDVFTYYNMSQLATPTGLSISETNIVSWNSVPEANGYVIKINSEEIEEPTTSFELRPTDVGQLTISVKAVGDNIVSKDSAYSSTVSKTIPFKLDTPQDFNVNGRIFSWSKVDDAVGYRLEINGVTYDVGNVLEYSVASMFVTVNARVMALGDNTVTTDSEYSEMKTSAFQTETISSEAELRAMESGKSYVLTSNIALAQDWTPIESFNGGFDGGNYTISNVRINSTDRFVGFFAKTSSATIVNLNLEINISANYANGVGELGGLVARMEDTNIQNCNVVVNITAQNYSVGGLVGVINDGEAANISNSSATGSINMTSGGTGYVGGFVGKMLTNVALIEKCQANVDVASVAFAGGFVGHAGYGKINDCLAVGNVSASADYAVVGGFVGECTGYNVRISRCLAITTVLATGASVNRGSFAGITPGGSYGGNIYANCYYDNTISSYDRIGNTYGRGDGISGVSTATLQNGTALTNFSASVWQFEIDSYPTLI